MVQKTFGRVDWVERHTTPAVFLVPFLVLLSLLLFAVDVALGAGISLASSCINFEL